MKIYNIKKDTLRLSIFIILFLIMSASLFSQITRVHTIDILNGINDGTIHVELDTAMAADEIKKIVDGNPFTSMAVQNIGTLTLKLHFDEPVEIDKSKLYMWNNGTYDLESADSEDDLDNQIGSYRLLVNDRDYAVFNWDSTEFDPIETSWLRLSVINPAKSGIIVGEWELSLKIIITGLAIFPDPIKMVPNTSLNADVKMVDANGNIYPYDLEEYVIWSSDTEDVVTIDEQGKMTAHILGTALINTESTGLSGSTSVDVVSDFSAAKAEIMNLKVALIIQNPIVDSIANKRIHQVWGWENPYNYVNQIIEEFHTISDGVINYQIVETHNDEGIFTRLGDSLMTIDTLIYFYTTSGKLFGRDTPGTLQYYAENLRTVQFDYNYMVDYYDLDSKRNDGEIDEVWVYAHPFAGMYESQLMGPGAFWWNSPPLNHDGLEKLLSVMGWNYERGVAEALHSYGHRMESAIKYVYGRWDCNNENPNSWELFTRFDKEVPGGAHIGNIHFPPNGQNDYDYGNTKYVTTYADNWKRYPLLLDQVREVNRIEWSQDVGTNYQLGYMRWWFNHIPKYTGIHKGVLNNWWHYAVDYEGAVERAKDLTGIDVENKTKIIPGAYSLEQNYPNPFNPETKIGFTIPKTQYVTLKVYDIL